MPAPTPSIRPQERASAHLADRLLLDDAVGSRKRAPPSRSPFAACRHQWAGGLPADGTARRGRRAPGPAGRTSRAVAPPGGPPSPRHSAPATGVGTPAGRGRRPTPEPPSLSRPRRRGGLARPAPGGASRRGGCSAPRSRRPSADTVVGGPPGPSARSARASRAARARRKGFRDRWHGGESIDVGHDRVTVLRGIGQAHQDEERRLGESAEVAGGSVGFPACASHRSCAVIAWPAISSRYITACFTTSRLSLGVAICAWIGPTSSRPSPIPQQRLIRRWRSSRTAATSRRWSEREPRRYRSTSGSTSARRHGLRGHGWAAPLGERTSIPRATARPRRVRATPSRDAMRSRTRPSGQRCAPASRSSAYAVACRRSMSSPAAPLSSTSMGTRAPPIHPPR